MGVSFGATIFWSKAVISVSPVKIPLIRLSITMKKSEVELYDFIQRPAKHKAGKYWHIVSWVILFLVVAFAFSLIYARTLESQGITKAEKLRHVQITNGIPQKSWTITYKNI